MIEVIDPRYRYYVYTLAYPDGTVFYVGKGAGGRILEHEAETQRGCMCRKCKIIYGIWADGRRVRRAIIFRTNDEIEALEKEKQIIGQYGYEQLCNGNPRVQTPRPYAPKRPMDFEQLTREATQSQQLRRANEAREQVELRMQRRQRAKDFRKRVKGLYGEGRSGD